MTRTPLLIAIVVTAALAGCSNEDQNNVAGTGDGNTTNAAVELPPSIAASKTYRCGDNTITYVDWMTDNKSANIRVGEGGAATMVTAPEPGQPMVSANGYSLTGTVSESSISLTTPEHGKQSCKA